MPETGRRISNRVTLVTPAVRWPPSNYLIITERTMSGVGHGEARPPAIERETHTSKEDTMGAKAEAFATQFEAKVEEVTALLERLDDTDWKKTTAAENWTVAATAHHLA